MTSGCVQECVQAVGKGSVCHSVASFDFPVPQPGTPMSRRSHFRARNEALKPIYFTLNGDRHNEFAASDSQGRLWDTHQTEDMLTLLAPVVGTRSRRRSTVNTYMSNDADAPVVTSSDVDCSVSEARSSGVGHAGASPWAPSENGDAVASQTSSRLNRETKLADAPSSGASASPCAGVPDDGFESTAGGTPPSDTCSWCSRREMTPRARSVAPSERIQSNLCSSCINVTPPPQLRHHQSRGKSSFLKVLRNTFSRRTTAKTTVSENASERIAERDQGNLTTDDSNATSTVPQAPLSTSLRAPASVQVPSMTDAGVAHEREVEPQLARSAVYLQFTDKFVKSIHSDSNQPLTITPFAANSGAQGSAARAVLGHPEVYDASAGDSIPRGHPNRAARRSGKVATPSAQEWPIVPANQGGSTSTQPHPSPRRSVAKLEDLRKQSRKHDPRARRTVQDRQHRSTEQIDLVVNPVADSLPVTKEPAMERRAKSKPPSCKSHPHGRTEPTTRSTSRPRRSSLDARSKYSGSPDARSTHSGPPDPRSNHSGSPDPRSKHSGRPDARSSHSHFKHGHRKHSASRNKTGTRSRHECDCYYCCDSCSCRPRLTSMCSGCSDCTCCRTTCCRSSCEYCDACSVMPLHQQTSCEHCR